MTIFRKSIAALGLAALLTGCVQYAEVTTPPVDLALKQSSIAPRIKGYQDVTVRSFVQEGTQTNEVTGAKCTLESVELKASVVTPGIVRMPIVKSRPSPLIVTCTGNGMKGTNVIEPRKSQDSGASGGLLGIVMNAALTAAIDRWYYAQGGLIGVTLKP